MHRTDEIRLQDYCECVGFLSALEVRQDAQVAVVLRARDNNVRLAFPAGAEGEALIRELGNAPVGQKVGILKTDSSQHPILVRRLPGQR